MTFFEIIGTLLIGPLKLLFEVIFEIANRFIGHPGLSIIVLSLIMNVLVLPLYRRADAMQEHARDIDAKLRDGVAHIKKTFSGDEKMMMLQTYYRQNNYKPTDALKGSVSLLLEIPFFIAAYQFLSHLERLNGVSLGPIADLSKADGLLVIGGITINILPVIMTCVNFISSAIYLKGFPLKTKVQLYGMALFFLVFLYTSPSGLVFYWTLNNIFSLVKTIFYKLKNPKKVLSVLLAVLGVPLFIYAAFLSNTLSLKKKIFLIAAAFIFEFPLVWSILKNKIKLHKNTVNESSDRKLFCTGTVFLTILAGLLIPSSFIASSPQEFVDITCFYHPLWYVVRSAAMAAGTFLIWFGVFYWLASPKGKVFFDRLVWILCGIMFVNYMFFGTRLGVISSGLQYETGLFFSIKEHVLNVVVIVLLAVLMYFIIRRWGRAAQAVLLTAAIALGVMSTVNVVKIKSSVDKIEAANFSEDQILNFSKDGKNVVVIMLDRGMGEYIPYIMNEKPELLEQFAGFTYYSNVISFGGSTNFGIPALLGGYEYTPVEMNKRAEEPLVSKHNEALKVMPVLFANNGYDVTMCDPVYANYQWIPDLSIFDEYPEINTYITKGKYSPPESKQYTIDNNKRNFFCLSIMKTMPLFVQPTIYTSGTYNQAISGNEENYTNQTTWGISSAQGLSDTFMQPYNVLCNMSDMTRITEGDVNTFLFISNDSTHEPMLLQEPEYVPAAQVDNTEYDAANTERFTVNGRTMNVVNDKQMAHYHANMAAFIKLGEWFDYLREQGVYDNTRIIIVSDHGRDLRHFDDFIYEESDSYKNIERYYPLLLVKDFNSTEFTVSEEFMTNADVPVLATKDLIENPVNPFTGKVITDAEKTAHDQFVTLSGDWDILENNGNTFIPSKWAKVKSDLRDKSNWEFYDKDIVLDEYEFPNE